MYFKKYFLINFFFISPIPKYVEKEYTEPILKTKEN